MRRHSFKTSPNRILFDAESQLWKVVHPSINSLSISGGRISNLLDYIPRKNQYDTVLFIGANGLFQKNGTIPVRCPSSVAGELNQLGNTCADRAKKVYIFGLPPSTKAVNEVLASNKSLNWDYIGMSKHIYSKQHAQGRRASYRSCLGRL